MTTPALDSPAGQRPAVQYLRVDAAQAGRRLDNFLRARWPDVPRSLVYRLIRQGAVRVNGRRVGPEAKLAEGDELRLPPVVQPPADAAPRIPPVWRERLARAVLYEDSELLVLDKPAGLPVHAGSGYDFGLIEALRGLRPELPFVELVHRLDRETSGCLLLAKDPRTLRHLNRLMAGKDGQGRAEEGVKKIYLALLRGPWQGGARVVDEPLARLGEGAADRRVSVDEAGREALTRFRPLRRFRDATLVEAELGTGRTHQVRVHAAHLGAPLAGDDRYGDRAFNRALRALGLKRMFLHAARLRFKPWPDRPAIDVRAPLPEDLERVLARLD